MVLDRDAMLLVLEKLDLDELHRTKCVCKVWRDDASLVINERQVLLLPQMNTSAWEVPTRLLVGRIFSSNEHDALSDSEAFARGARCFDTLACRRSDLVQRAGSLQGIAHFYCDEEHFAFLFPSSMLIINEECRVIQVFNWRTVGGLHAQAVHLDTFGGRLYVAMRAVEAPSQMCKRRWIIV